ncbi:MAG TPA: hypothetical protein VIM56_02635 [Rhizomicrobium sp.]
MLLFGLLMLFIAGLSQFFGFSAIAFDEDIELLDDMVLPAIVLPDMAFVAALVQLCVALMALWCIALPLDIVLLDMELLDIALPCAKA